MIARDRIRSQDLASGARDWRGVRMGIDMIIVEHGMRIMLICVSEHIMICLRRVKTTLRRGRRSRRWTTAAGRMKNVGHIEIFGQGSGLEHLISVVARQAL